MNNNPDYNQEPVIKMDRKIPRWLIGGIATNIVIAIIASLIAPTLHGEEGMLMFIFIIPSLIFFGLITQSSSVYFNGLWYIIFILPTIITYFFLGAIISSPIVFSKLIWHIKKYIIACLAVVAVLIFYNVSDAVQQYVIKNIAKESLCFLISPIRYKEMSNCFYNQAWKENNEAICGQVYFYQNECYKDLALNKKDPSICLGIDTEEVIRCLITTGAEANICADQKIKDKYRNQCYERVGINKGDVSACIKISDGNRNACYRGVAVATGNQSLCYGNIGNNRRDGDDCVERVYKNKLKEAIVKNDMVICDQLTDQIFSRSKCRANYFPELDTYLSQKKECDSLEQNDDRINCQNDNLFRQFLY